MVGKIFDVSGDFIVSNIMKNICENFDQAIKAYLLIEAIKFYNNEMSFLFGFSTSIIIVIVLNLASLSAHMTFRSL